MFANCAHVCDVASVYADQPYDDTQPRAHANLSLRRSRGLIIVVGTSTVETPGKGIAIHAQRSGWYCNNCRIDHGAP